jgi:hypothetical protein
MTLKEQTILLYHEFKVTVISVTVISIALFVTHVYSNYFMNTRSMNFDISMIGVFETGHQQS